MGSRIGLASADYWIGYFAVPVVALLVIGFVVLAVVRAVGERRRAREWSSATLTMEELERPPTSADPGA